VVPLAVVFGTNADRVGWYLSGGGGSTWLKHAYLYITIQLP